MSHTRCLMILRETKRHCLSEQSFHIEWFGGLDISAILLNKNEFSFALKTSLIVERLALAFAYLLPGPETLTGRLPINSQTFVVTISFSSNCLLPRITILYSFSWTFSCFLIMDSRVPADIPGWMDLERVNFMLDRLLCVLEILAFFRFHI